MLLIGCWLLACPFSVVAKDLARQAPILKTIQLGTPDGQLLFAPNQLTLKNGTLYKLTLSNPSQLKHYFTALAFANAVWTRKVEVAGVEIKGKIQELELKSGATVDWTFVPLQAGSYPLLCTIPGHADAGMIGQILISE